MPLLLVALAVTPPILLYETPKEPSAQRQRLAPWKGLLHAGAVAAAVVAARFAIFDIIQYLSGARPEVGSSSRSPKALALCVLKRNLAPQAHSDEPGCWCTSIRCSIANEGGLQTQHRPPPWRLATGSTGALPGSC